MDMKVFIVSATWGVLSLLKDLLKEMMGRYKKQEVISLDCIRLETDIWWIAAGERIDDSIVRRAMMKKSGSIDVQRGRFYPVSMWKKREIIDYIKFHNLYLGQDSRKLGFSFKSLWGKELSMVKEYFPDDYQKIIRLYPFAGAGVKRFEEYGEE